MAGLFTSYFTFFSDVEISYKISNCYSIIFHLRMSIVLYLHLLKI